jgi:hypothetical protein
MANYGLQFLEKFTGRVPREAGANGIIFHSKYFRALLHGGRAFRFNLFVAHCSPELDEGSGATKRIFAAIPHASGNLLSVLQHFKSLGTTQPINRNSSIVIRQSK